MTDSNEILYEVQGRVAHVTLNRPERLNAISATLPLALQQAVERANEDDNVHVIILKGSGRVFCSGWDLKEFAEKQRPVLGSQTMPWDPILDFRYMNHATQCFMSVWRSLKPVIARVQGFAVAGGSDIALCCDMIVMEEGAKIGYPPARLWGCPTTFMWAHRVGMTWAKRLLLTGDLIDGIEAEKIGLITKAVPSHLLDAEVQGLALRVASIPKNQLAMQKIVINQAFELMGLGATQRLATVFDGVSRHSPEGVAWKEIAERNGVKHAVQLRDSGEWQPGHGTEADGVLLESSRRAKL